MAEYSHLRKKDTAIIKELQDGSESKPRKIIKSLLESEIDHDSLRFKSHLAELHYQLDKVALTHNGSRLSFTNLNLAQNSEKHKSFVDESENVYKAERTSDYWQAYIQAKGGRTLLDFRKPIYNIEELIRDTSYIRLEKKIQKRIREMFCDIDPQKPTSVISKAASRQECIKIKSQHPCSIIKDCEVVAKACINVLYALRCMLFHGEVSPNSANRRVYENAFYLLQLIVNRLK
ncbi:MAG: hypothetical protein ACRYG7_47905 [Janthinobacterium lividum]